MRTARCVLIGVVSLLAAAGTAVAQSRPASAPAASSAPVKPAAKPQAAAEEEEEEESYPSWSLDASVGVNAGYDSKASVTRMVLLQDDQASATSELSASIGPTLSLSETLSSSLEYSFSHKLNYSNHDLDAQTHGLSLSGKYGGKRVEASLSYGVSLVALLPKNVFYSIEHQPKATLEVLLIKPLYLAAEYGLHYYDIREASSAYLNGAVHTIEVYPDLYFSARLNLYGGYQLQVAKLGILAETVAAPGRVPGQPDRTVPYDSGQSYVGHFFYLHGKWKPHGRVTLTLDGKIGRKIYPAGFVFELERKDTTVAVQRTDGFGNVEVSAAWRFWRGLTLEGSFSYEKSRSSLSAEQLSLGTQKQQASYDALAGTLGASWKL